MALKQSNGFAENIFSGRIQGRVNKNLVAKMTDALFLVSIEASNKAPIGPADKGGGRLRANIHKNIFQVGNKTVGEFIFRQRYAGAQHENLTFRHPRGGESEYAKKALQENAQKVMRMLASGAFK